jgi:hypothetical protein
VHCLFRCHHAISSKYSDDKSILAFLLFTFDKLSIKRLTKVLPPLTDACLQGGAGYYEGDFFYVNWDIDLPQFKNYHINIKETMAIVLSVINGLLVYHTAWTIVLVHVVLTLSRQLHCSYHWWILLWYRNCELPITRTVLLAESLKFYFWNYLCLLATRSHVIWLFSFQMVEHGKRKCWRTVCVVWKARGGLNPLQELTVLTSRLIFYRCFTVLTGTEFTLNTS